MNSVERTRRKMATLDPKEVEKLVADFKKAQEGFFFFFFFLISIILFILILIF